MTLILTIDDNFYLCSVLQEFLESTGYEVLVAPDGQTALDLLATHDVALVLAEILLPEMDGFALCEAIRQQSAVPIIITSVLTQTDDIVRALDAGADDYLTKPFNFQVLEVHIEALLRRVAWIQNPSEFPTQCPDFTLNPDKQEVIVSGTVVHLTPVEYRMLQYLMSRMDHTVRAETLFEAMWGRYRPGQRRALYTNIFRLRQKIEADPQHPRRIVTVSSGGYRFCSAGHSG